MRELERHLWQKLNHYYPTYLVGGAVRDMLMNKEPKDYDFSTKARPGQVAGVFKDHKVDFVGAHFGVVMVDGVEFATFREDIGDTVKYADTIYEDLSRRDLTINAMAMTFNGLLADPHNGGRDIKERRIRFVGDPAERIVEDPVRMIRALRFSCSLGFNPCWATEVAIMGNAYLIRSIARERIQLEIMKVLGIKQASKFFHWAQQLGVLPYVITGLGSTYGHIGGKHHGENVFDHLMLTGDAIHPKYPMVKLAGYLHDVAKPMTYDSEAGTFLQHHTKGEHVVRATLQRLKFSTAQVEAVSGLTRCHMHTVSKGSSPKSIRKLIPKLAEYGLTWRDFLRLRIADHKANLAKAPYTISEIKGYIKAFQIEEKVTLSTHGLALSGGDIIKLLNLKPGPAIGQLQKHLLNYVIENGESFNVEEILIEEVVRHAENHEETSRG